MSAFSLNRNEQLATKDKRRKGCQLTSRFSVHPYRSSRGRAELCVPRGSRQQWGRIERGTATSNVSDSWLELTMLTTMKTCRRRPVVTSLQAPELAVCNLRQTTITGLMNTQSSCHVWLLFHCIISHFSLDHFLSSFSLSAILTFQNIFSTCPILISTGASITSDVLFHTRMENVKTTDCKLQSLEPSTP